jgi:hypothetical protein
MRAIGSFISAIYSKLPSYKQTVGYVSSSIASALRALSSLGFLFSSCTRSSQISAVRLTPSKKNDSGVSAVTGAALSVLAPASSGKGDGRGDGGGSSSIGAQASAKPTESALPTSSETVDDAAVLADLERDLAEMEKIDAEIAAAAQAQAVAARNAALDAELDQVGKRLESVVAAQAQAAAARNAGLAAQLDQVSKRLESVVAAQAQAAASGDAELDGLSEADLAAEASQAYQERFDAFTEDLDGLAEELADLAAEASQASQERFDVFQEDLEELDQELKNLDPPKFHGPAQLSAQFVADERAFQAQIRAQQSAAASSKKASKLPSGRERLQPALVKMQYSFAKIKAVGKELIRTKKILLELGKSAKTKAEKLRSTPLLTAKIKRLEKSLLEATTEYETDRRELENLNRSSGV